MNERRNFKKTGKNKDNFSHQNDGIFAQLTDMFGDSNDSDIILDVCKKCNWDLTRCIDSLIHISSLVDTQKKISERTLDELQSLKIAYQTPDNMEDIADDVDVVIESENIETNENLITDLGAIRKQMIKNDITNSSRNMQAQNTLFQSSKTSNLQTEQKPSISSFLKNGENSFSFPSDTQKINKNTNRNRIQNPPNYDKIIHLINQGTKIMIIMRGCPGTGKSFTSKRIVDETVKGDYKNHIFSSDDYFYDKSNRYAYRADLVPVAHDWNKGRIEKATKEGWSPIFVDNTNIKVWEMIPYCNLAIKYQYFIEILEPIPPWGNQSAGQLANKNNHFVPKDKIERMMNNYESISVLNLLRNMNAEKHLQLSPQTRNLPLFISNNVETNMPKDTKIIPVQKSEAIISLNRERGDDCNSTPLNIKKDCINIVTSTTVAKPPRQNKIVKSQSDINLTENLNLPNSIGPIDWKKHEQEMREFWSGSTKKIDETVVDKAQIKTSLLQVEEPQPLTLNNKFAVLANDADNNNNSNFLNDDIDDYDEYDVLENLTENKLNVILTKHKINCANENSSFSQIRQIYPHVPVSYLWDLFETCKGDGDWTMDILLKEESKIDQFIQKKKFLNDEFNCNCDTQSIDLMWFQDTPIEISPLEPPPPIPQIQPTNVLTPIKSRREKPILTEEIINAKKRIEENIVFGDEHYSDHSRKIRDIKRGVQPQLHEIRPQWSGGSLNELGAYAVLPGDNQDIQSNDGETSSETDNDEIIEITLGQEFVTQLDQMFGVETFSKTTTMEDFKTNVFMSKCMAKQLYALWMESVYNQIEEQKHQSIKEDEEFAKALIAQEQYPELQQHQQTTNFKDIMDMQKAWAAYKIEMDEWKNEPVTLASKLAKEKLYQIFPLIDKETLEEVLVAHKNQFDETVETLKNSLQYNLDDEMETQSRELLEKARRETETTAAEGFNLTKSSSNSSTRSLEIKKLGPEEAKRSALKEFEECRNMAAHHSQLKTDCYTNAKRAASQNNGPVSVYYSQIASLHKQKIEMYNHKAANCIMEVHNLTQNNPDIIDLHYYHSTEAIESLDIFIDKHINKLKTNPKNNKMIHVITGRGLHSVNNIPTIKNKVRHRLRERGLKAIEVNPGLLKVKLFVNSKLTQQFLM